MKSFLGNYALSQKQLSGQSRKGGGPNHEMNPAIIASHPSMLIKETHEGTIPVPVVSSSSSSGLWFANLRDLMAENRILPIPTIISSTDMIRSQARRGTVEVT